MSAWIDANRDLQARVDYDIMVPAHGDIGTKADLDDSTQYMVELLAAVTEADDRQYIPQKWGLT